MTRTLRALHLLRPLGAGLSVAAVCAAALVAVTPPSRGAAGVPAPTSVGRTFWALFQGNQLSNPALSLRVVSRHTGTVTLTQPSGTSTTLAVGPGTVATASLPGSLSVRDANGAVVRKAVRVESTVPGAVFLSNHYASSGGATVALPEEALGTRYRAISSPPVGYTSRMVVTATADTMVTITPSDGVNGRTAGVPFTVALLRGQSTTLTGADVSGTLVASDAPLLVHVGNDCAGLYVGGRCDHMSAVLPPTSAWGRTFVIVPFADDAPAEPGALVRIVADRDDTTVLIEGAPLVLDAGESVTTRVATDPSAAGAVIIADQPVLVAQFLEAGSYGPGYDGDPDMLVVTPVEQMVTEHLVTTPGALYGYNALQVVVPVSGAGTVMIDGAPVPASEFEVVQGSGHAVMQREVTPGVHDVTAGVPIAVSAYGVDSGTSYAHPASLALADLTVVATPEPSQPAGSSGAVPTPEPTSPATETTGVTTPAGPSGAVDGATGSATPSDDAAGSTPVPPTVTTDPQAPVTDPGGAASPDNAPTASTSSTSPIASTTAVTGTTHPVVLITTSVIATTSTASSTAPAPTASPTKSVTASPTPVLSATSSRPVATVTVTRVATATAPRVTVSLTRRVTMSAEAATRISARTFTVRGFAAGSSRLSAQQARAVGSQVRGTARRTAITCTGYSARGGDAAALRTLGLARATAVCDRIAAQTGARTTVSYGGALPVLVPGTSGQNRKVVVRIG